MKTEYRLIPLKTYSGDMYLQYKSTKEKINFFGKKKIVEVWRFVPKATPSYVLGRYLNEESCPTSLPLFDEDKFISCFYNQENYELVPFTKKYENISDYFSHLSKLRSDYLQEQLEKKNQKTVYL